MTLYRGIALTIAGSDSGGGAGIQADLKTFSALKVFGTSAITALTAQNSLGVHQIFNIPAEMVRDQIEAVLGDFPMPATKTGMVSQVEIIEAIARKIRAYSIKRLVVDPVMISQSGHPLISKDAIQALQNELFPLAFLVTPNLPEAEKLTSMSIKTLEEMKEAAKKIAEMGPHAVLIKGGHKPGNTVQDVLYCQEKFYVYEDNRIDTKNTHGTGCTLSAAITAELASGCELLPAVERGRKYVRKALENHLKPGSGDGCLGHAVAMEWLS